MSNAIERITCCRDTLDCVQDLTSGRLTQCPQCPFYTQREQEEAAKLYDDFVESFKGDEPGTKTFVRGGTINPNAKLSDGAFAETGLT